MTNVRMCDECKKLEQEFANWLEIRPDEQILSFTPQVASTQDHHFCSWTCIAAFAARKTEQGAPA